ncbi:MAG: hypothetical protein ACP5Q1_03485 [Anaerolineae bacterium]
MRLVISLILAVFFCQMLQTPLVTSITKVQDTSFIRVPQDADLQIAINEVSEGGMIEIAAGTYPSPIGGFVISDLGKTFTIRAAAGATVILDGGGSREIITFVNSHIDLGGLVTFQDLIFANGKATSDGRAGGATLQRAQAHFLRCTFRNNQGVQPNTGGGGVLVALGSRATFKDCKWEGNAAKNFGGGLAVNDQAEVTIYNSLFVNNKTNVLGHSLTAAGGAIHVGNSILMVDGSRFEGNQAGYVGGAIYAIGNWGNGTRVVVGDSVFMQNSVAPAYTLPWPTEGGAFHAEDQTIATIYDSRFIRNQAMTGGALSLYRAVVNVSRTVFQDNMATGTGAANGFGGAISAVSNDTPADGDENRRAAQLTVVDSVITSTLSYTGQSGGGIYTAGDGNRAYGLNGVSQQGMPADNRATVILERVIVFNTHVQEAVGVPGTGVGAAILVDLVDLTVKDSMIMSNKAAGTGNSSGGGLAIINNSLARLERVTVAYNAVGKFGGGIFVQGSTIQAQDCALFGNRVDNGEYGSAIFAAPDDWRNIDAEGFLFKCTVSDNVGLPIFDDDRDTPGGPINDVRYNTNRIYPPQEGYVYRNSLVGKRDVDGLNGLTVVRIQSGRNTKKVESPNIRFSTQPAVGTLLAIPPYSLPFSSITLHYYLGFSWSGISAELNGALLVTKAGVIEVAGAGVYTLTVTGDSSTLTVTAEIRALQRSIYLPLVMRASP